MKRRFIIEATIDESRMSRLVEDDPSVWGVHDFVDAFTEGAVGEDAAMVANEEIS